MLVLAGVMPCTCDGPSLKNPSSMLGCVGRVQAGASNLWPSALFQIITGIQGLRLSPVSDCRAHRGSNRLRRRGGMALEVLELQVGGICCRDGTGPGPNQGSLGGRRSWADYLGCWVGAGGGGRRLSMKPMKGRLTKAYCPPSQGGQYGYASGLVAPLMLQNACHRDLRQTPSYRRGAVVHWGA